MEDEIGEKIKRTEEYVNSEYSEYTDILYQSTEIVISLGNKITEIIEKKDVELINKELSKIETVIIAIMQTFLTLIPSYDERIKLLDFLKENQLLFINSESVLDHYFKRGDRDG